jgi:hypothetical protein
VSPPASGRGRSRWLKWTAGLCPWWCSKARRRHFQDGHHYAVWTVGVPPDDFWTPQCRQHLPDQKAACSDHVGVTTEEYTCVGRVYVFSIWWLWTDWHINPLKQAIRLLYQLEDFLPNYLRITYIWRIYYNHYVSSTVHYMAAASLQQDCSSFVDNLAEKAIFLISLLSLGCRSIKKLKLFDHWEKVRNDSRSTILTLPTSVQWQIDFMNYFSADFLSVRTRGFSYISWRHFWLYINFVCITYTVSTYRNKLTKIPLKNVIFPAFFLQTSPWCRNSPLWRTPSSAGSRHKHPQSPAGRTPR